MDRHSVEYEVIADANFVGEITYGPYYFRIWDMPFHREGEKRLLCLRIEQKESLPPLPPTKADEFVYLASLFLRRRLVLGPMTRWDNKPSRSPSGLRFGSDQYVDIDIVRGESNLGDLSVWLPLIEHLDPAICNKFILAVRFYSQALEYMEVGADIAYLNLVSAIETLCQDMDIGKRRLADLNDKSLENSVNKIRGPKLKREIKQAIINREGFIKRKFIKFIEQHTDKSFWDYKCRPRTHGRVYLKDLRRLLGNIYDQRSRTLHGGDPFPDYIFRSQRLADIAHIPRNRKFILREIPTEEIPVGTSIAYGGRTWKSKDYIPYPHFFERLVNHVLKSYLKAH